MKAREIKTLSYFRFGNDSFRVLDNVPTEYGTIICKHVQSGKWVPFSPDCQVVPVEQLNYKLHASDYKIDRWNNIESLMIKLIESGRTDLLELVYIPKGHTNYYQVITVPWLYEAFKKSINA